MHDLGNNPYTLSPVFHHHPENIASRGGKRSDYRICGILGSIRLLDGWHLIVAKHRNFVGILNGQAIWQLAGYDVLPYAVTTGGLAEEQRAHNATYLAMLHQVLDTPFFYFSYTYDLSHSLQRRHAMGPPALNAAGLADNVDKRFTWNAALLTNCHSANPSAAGGANALRQYALPLVHGFVSIHALSVNGQPFTWALVSRRSVQRAGTRLVMRGIDAHGHCANFVETEQIVECGPDEKASFVQTRGSIPLFWTQAPNLKYKPRPTLDAGRDHTAAARLHVGEQLALYGRQVMVSLIDHCGAEKQLEEGFGQLVAQLGMPTAVRYESFDFHAECRKMRWDRLDILIDRLAHEQDEFGQFQVRRDGTVLLQGGVFRTNCIDCLDRTNVVQSMLAKRSLQQTLQRMGILRGGQTVDGTVGLSALYKNVWADNADLVSTQYSGTGALKTDFTRTGKRTTQGALWDGVNSAVRYYKNNFRDGQRQDAIDLFLGNYVVGDQDGWKSPLQRNRGWKYNMVSVDLLYYKYSGLMCMIPGCLFAVAIGAGFCVADVRIVGGVAARVQHRESVVPDVLGNRAGRHDSQYFRVRHRVCGLSASGDSFDGCRIECGLITEMRCSLVLLVLMKKDKNMLDRSRLI